jgi:hypothetical protein
VTRNSFFSHLQPRCARIAVPASSQTHSESQQDDREYEQSDGSQAIIVLPKVNDEHHYHADDWQQDQHGDPDGDDAHIAQDRQPRRTEP